MSAKQLPTNEPCYELSPMQSGMLFQALLCDQGGNSSGFDIEQLHLVLKEELNVAALQSAFDQLTARHSILSTSFHWENLEHPKQLINADVSVPIQTENWEGLDTAQRAKRRAELLRTDRARGFNLSKAPLMRATVIRTAPCTSELIWTFHHILLDGRSFGPLLTELFSTYDELLNKGIKVFAAPARPYADYITWLRSVDLEPGLAYFRALLAGKRDPTPLPCAEPKGRACSNDGYGESVCSLDEEVVRLARQCAERTGTSLGTLIQGAWALVLARYTGDQDVVFGSCRTCRHSALNGDAASMVGLFINTLPIRLRLSDAQTIEDLLIDVRRQNIELRNHEHCPLVEVAKVAEYGGNNPLFETLVMFENRELCQELITSEEPRWRDCTISLHERPSIPLSITVYQGAKFEVRAIYDCDRLKHNAVDRLLAAFGRALALLATQPGRRVAELDVLPPEERDLVLFRWNSTARPFPDQLCIHEPFEASAERTPDAPAVEEDGVSLSYRELEQRANRIARALQARGAGPNVYIGLCLCRGIDLVAGLLAIAKSGAAYVPLDPTYPKDRLSFMLTDSQVALVVTEGRYLDLFDVPCFVLERESAALLELPAERPPCSATPQDVCYAIFTSGSTGIPKGVVLTHRAVVNTLDWVNRQFEVGARDRLLFVTSHCFDLSVYDTFGILAAGGTVVVASDELLSDPVALATAMVDQKITIWDSAPAALQRITP
ncbi:MAG TPA: condensation domain-containing protein, partial [Polyangiaceae bacterium]|nr:condensation domain-containing protein [Polyangiaceae bacterium]